MSDIELVVKIPDKLYKSIKSDEYGVHQGRIYDIIRHGIPLPKGHGDLIDANKLWNAYHDLDYDFYEAFDLADTIIEADEQEDKI